MLTKETIENLINKFMDSNKQLINEKNKKIYTFQQKELDLKIYHEALSLLENQEKDINLTYFEKIKDVILIVLSDFNTEDINENINKVYQAENYMINIKKELIEITKIIDTIKDNWRVFLEKNKEFSNSHFNEYFYEKIEENLNKIKNINSQKVSEANSDLNKFKEEVFRYIKNVNKCKEYINTYMFIGFGAKIIKRDLEELIEKQSKGIDLSSDFFNKFNEISENIENEMKNAILGKGKVEVVNVYSQSGNINKYTFKFADYILKYDTFFNNESLKIEHTNQYFYFNNLPLKGIFKGSEVITNLDIDNDYVKANEYMKNLMTKYIISSTVLVVILYIIGFFINIEYFSVFHLISSISLFAFLPFAFRNKKQLVAKKFNIEKFFLYEEVNILYFKDGANIDLKDLFIGTIREIDDTILNENFIKENIKDV